MGYIRPKEASDNVYEHGHDEVIPLPVSTNLFPFLTLTNILTSQHLFAHPTWLIRLDIAKQDLRKVESKIATESLRHSRDPTLRLQIQALYYIEHLDIGKNDM